MVDQTGVAGRATVFILMRATGSYDDYRTTPISAFSTEVAANCASSAATVEWRAACESYRDIPYLEGDRTDEEWKKWERARGRENTKFKRGLAVDPGAAPTGAWSSPGDEPDYFVVPVPMIATGDPS